MANAARRWADPRTLDYVLEHGAPRSDPTLVTDALRRVLTRRKSVPTLTTFGSQLHEVRKLVRNVERQVEQYIRDALADLVVSRRMRDLVIQVSVDRSRGAVLWEAAFRDRAGDVRTVRSTHQVR